jgi:hypothetical protein
MGDSAHTYNPPYKPGKKSAPPVFLEDENIFQKSATSMDCDSWCNQRGRFLKKDLIFEKRGGADAF